MGGEETAQASRVTSADPPISIRIERLAPQHAASAACLHIAGQPGTFLSSLGPDILEVVYAALPRSDVGFGFVALPADSRQSPDAIVGFVSATTDVGRLLMETSGRQAGKLLPLMMARLARRPALIGRSVQTLLYPLLVRDTDWKDGGKDKEQTRQMAELLSIMVEQKRRSHGIGAMLLDALIEECAARGISHLDVTVDADNQEARRFYARHAFTQQKSFNLYGRQMAQYGRKV